MMLDRLIPGDTIVVTRLFSFADSMRHLSELLDQFQNRKVYLYSLNENINTREDSGRLFHKHVETILEFHGDLISESTKKGLDEAKEKGTKLGRPRKLDENVMKAIRMYESNKYTLAQIREETGISKTTLYRYLEN